jgi:hypothetical protein
MRSEVRSSWRKLQKPQDLTERTSENTYLLDTQASKGNLENILSAILEHHAALL